MNPEEISFSDALPTTLGLGERESMAISKFRQSILLANESRVFYHCRQLGIQCIRLAAILRALWVGSIISKSEVQDIINDLQIKDGMIFKRNTLDAIMSDK